MCIPRGEVLSQKRYEDIVSDTENVDQIIQILIRYKKLEPSIIEPLSFVIPRICAWDFAKFRDDKVELRHLRAKVLGIPPNTVVNMDDIDERVAEYERSLKKLSERKETERQTMNTQLTLPDDDHEKRLYPFQSYFSSN